MRTTRALLLLSLLPACADDADPSRTLEAFPGETGELRRGPLPGIEGPRERTYEVHGDTAVVEGDMLFDLTRARSITIQSASQKWPDGVVPFTIDPTLPSPSRVTSAIAHWEANTPIRFVPRTTQADYVTFRPSDGCSSFVGRTGGQQFINLAGGCWVPETIHEIGHAVGLWHEQSRNDRDGFVAIDWGNIQAGKAYNFEKESSGLDWGVYDYASIMHYPTWAFAIDGTRPTITATQPVPPGVILGEMPGLSAGDVSGVWNLYGKGMAVIGGGATPLEESRAANGDWLGGWHYGVDNQLIGVGNFDGAGGKEILVQSGWGFGVLRRDTDGQLRSIAAAAVGSSIGSFLVTADTQLVSIGNFDGVAGDELILRKPWGIVVARVNASTGAFTAITSHAHGTYLGTWGFGASDSFGPRGDFDADGRDDLVIRSGWGMGIVELDGALRLRAIGAAAYGTWISGSWNFGPDTVFKAAGKLDGVAGADLLVRSGWGIGVWRLSAGAPQVVTMQPYGSWLGTWGFGAADDTSVIGNFDGDAREDVVIRNAWGTGFLELDASNNLVAYAAAANGSVLSGWTLSASDFVAAIGDQNGDGKDELTLRNVSVGGGLVWLRAVGANITALSVRRHEDRIGSWTLTKEDKPKLFGDLDGDGRTELVLVRPVAFP